MSEISAITRLREQRHALVTDMRRIIDDTDREGRDLTAEELQEVEQRDAEIAPLDREIAVREKALRLTPKLTIGDERGLTANSEHATITNREDSEEYRKAFLGYMRTGGTEYRDHLLSPASSGGYTVPRGFLNTLVEYRTFFGPVRSISNVFSTDAGNTLDIPTVTARGAAAWTAEAAAYNEADETFGQVVFSAYKLTRIVQVSEELLQDSAFDLEPFLARRFGEALAVAENTAFVSGNGSGRPVGIIDSTAGFATTDTAANNAITFDDLLALLHSVGRQYRTPGRASWLMSDSMFRYLRRIKTGVASDLRYLWSESTQAGEPDMLFGHAYYIDPDMTSVTGTTINASTRYIAFGDFNEGYWIRDAGPIQVMRLNERYREVGQIGFLCNHRVDAHPVNGDAVRVLKTIA